MDIQVESFIGYFATFLTVVAFLPQVVKVWKTKGVKDISLGMYLLLVSGALSWIVYGFLVSDVPIIITNVAIFVLELTVVIFKVYYDR